MDLLIGSRALHAHIFDYPIRDETDWDIISYSPKSNFNGFNVEVHNPNEYLSERFFQFAEEDVLCFINDEPIHLCSLEGLAVIKRSHLALDYFWNKHIGQYHKFLKSHFRMEHWDLMKAREKITLQNAKQRHPSLMMTNDRFLNHDYVTKKYDHDWLHEQVAFYERPLYERLKYEDKFHLAWCEQELFEQLSHQEKLECVVEEVMVIALERFLIPGIEKVPGVAFQKSLRKVCTTLCSGWFRDFAIDNWEQLRLMCDRVKLKELRSKYA